MKIRDEGKSLEQLFGRVCFRTCGHLPCVAAPDEIEGDLLILTLEVNDKESGGPDIFPSLLIEKQRI